MSHDVLRKEKELVNTADSLYSSGKTKGARGTLAKIRKNNYEYDLIDGMNRKKIKKLDNYVANRNKQSDNLNTTITINTIKNIKNKEQRKKVVEEIMSNIRIGTIGMSRRERKIFINTSKKKLQDAGLI